MISNKITYLLNNLLLKPSLLFNLIGIRIAFALRLKRVPCLPLELDVEPNNTCNFKCGHCQVTYWDKKPAYLNRETFTQVLEQFPNLMRVKLQGMGEPMLNKQLIPMLKAGEERGIKMHFHTNGSICDRERAEQLGQLQHTHIAYSIDGATAATFEQMRPGSQFDRIIANIKLLMSMRKPSGNLLVSAWAVITKKNIGELPQIVQLAQTLGIDRIVIQPQLTNWGKEKMLSKIEDIQVTAESDLFVSQLAIARKTATETGIEINVNESDRFCRKHPCPLAWNSSYIAANGDVIPCNIIADVDIVKMGNVFEQDFKEIWNSAAYQNLRERIRNHDLPEHCKHCYVDPD